MRSVFHVRWTRVSLAVLGVVVLLTVYAVGQTQALGDREATERECETETQAQNLTNVLSFDPSTGRLPEGIAISKSGVIYLGVQPTGEILRLGPQGQFSIVADLDQGFGFMLGIAIDERGNLFASLNSFDPATHGVWRIDGHGAARRVAAMPTSSLPNELAFDLDGNLYIADTFLGAVWKLSTSGELGIWVAGPLLEGTGALFGIAAGANGLAFFKEDNESEEGDRESAGALYVSNTDRGTVVRIPVLENGSAGVPTVFAQHDLLVSADGIRFDKKGNLYVAVNLQNTVVRVDPCAQVEIVLQGLDRPASLAFGTARGEKKLLYVTNFAFVTGKHLVRVDVGIRGLPLP